MAQSNMLAMILAGGRGSRLHELTNKVAKPAVSYGGKYRIIDFPLSNCANSGIDIVGVLTQYESVLLNSYVAAGGRWGLDTKDSGVFVLTPREKADSGLDVYRGTADAISQNIDFIDAYDPEYLLVLSGDHIYKMNYDKMLTFHKEQNADATIAVRSVPMKEASRFGIMNTDDERRIIEFEEKPLIAESNNISIGVYIIRRRHLIEVLERCAREDRHDFVKDVLVRYRNVRKIYGYKLNTYWRNIATVESYYKTNMDFLKKDVREYFFKQYPDIYSKVDDLPPAKYNAGSDVSNSIVSSGCIINGKVENSVLFKDVYIGNNCTIKNSIVLNDVYIGDDSYIENCIVESRDTLRPGTNYVGSEEEIKIVIEKNVRYIL